MALKDYGVLIGTLHHFERDQPDNFGKYYHGMVFVNTPNGVYRCAVDVNKPNGGVQHRVIEGLQESLFSKIDALPNGFTHLDSNSFSGALDYVRSPLLRIRLGCLFVRMDPALELFRRFLEGIFNLIWVNSTGNESLDRLEAMVTGAQRLFIFGEPFFNAQQNERGMHDVHMNQGDPPGPFQHLDAIWQDGAVIVRTAGGRLDAFLVKFSTQSLNTGDDGLPLP
ncbi:MAG TPA: DUF2278 family protein [Longimicrobium sp.]|nr:DUF2278 family protein [Longimicrobium sp.]